MKLSLVQTRDLLERYGFTGQGLHALTDLQRFCADIYREVPPGTTLQFVGAQGLITIKLGRKIRP